MSTILIAPLILKAFELIGTGTRSKAEVLRQVTALGLRTRQDKNLSGQTFEQLLRNPLYAGRVVIPSWGVNERGNFDSIVAPELFACVQDVLDGKRLSITPHVRNHVDFPLRVFVRCGSCGEPLTGSWSKGRSRLYPYYRCRNAECKAVNARKEHFEREFTIYMEQLRPDRSYMRLFAEVVKSVWNQKQDDTRALLRAANQRLLQLTERKNRLVDAFLEGRLDQATYDEQNARIKAESAEAEQHLRDAEAAQIDVEQVLDFADRLVANPARMWQRAGLEQQQRLQKAFFPEGLSYSRKNGFGTELTHTFFGFLQAYSGENQALASPTGFEPVLPP